MRVKKYQWLASKVALLGGLVIFMSGYQAYAANIDLNGKVKVSKVQFLANGTSGKTLKSDNLAKVYNSWHWVDELNNADPNDQWPDGKADPDNTAPIPADKIKSYPYSYEATAKPKVKALFKTKGIPSGTKLFAMGTATTGDSTFVLPEQELVGGLYKEKIATKVIVNTRKIRCYITQNRGKAWNLDDPLVIEWKVREAGGTWFAAGNTKHTVYVTWDKPSTALVQETLYNVACRNANNVILANNGKNVVDAIWGDFTDHSVIRMLDEKSMKYWGPNGQGNVTTSKLLLHGDGQCGAWGDVFKDVHLVHKITVAKKGIVPDPAAGVIGFQVKNIQFGPVRVNNPPANHQFCKYYRSEINMAPAGLPGQGMPTPGRKGFLDHCVNMFDGILYDPSYGKKYGGPNPLKNWEEASLGSFTCNVQVTHPTTGQFITNLAEPNDPFIQQVKWN